MRKVELRMNEQNKYEIIKKLVETNGNKQRGKQQRKKEKTGLIYCRILAMNLYRESTII